MKYLVSSSRKISLKEYLPSERIENIFNKLQTKASVVGNNYKFPYEREIIL